MKNQQVANILVNYLFIVSSTRFERCFRPSSGALDYLQLPVVFTQVAAGWCHGCVETNFVVFFFFFFFRWCYSPLWALACRTIPLHLFLSITNSLHLLTPQHLKISFHFFSPSFPGSSSSSRPFQFFSADLFGASYPAPFSPGDPTNLGKNYQIL